MFCPNCGADGQSKESYCKRCGEWLPDMGALARPGLFRKRTREEKIRKMRLLEAISAGLSLIAAFVIFTVLAGGNDTNFLFLAAICCILVTVYQAINFYLGYKLQQKVDHSRDKGEKAIEAHAEQSPRSLGAADTSQFTAMHSVTENTTELLEPVPRVTERDKRR